MTRCLGWTHTRWCCLGKIQSISKCIWLTPLNTWGIGTLWEDGSLPCFSILIKSCKRLWLWYDAVVCWLSMYCFIVMLPWKPQGREEGAVIDDWEDPDLSVYKSTDRYGFMQWVCEGVWGVRVTSVCLNGERVGWWWYPHIQGHLPCGRKEMGMKLWLKDVRVFEAFFAKEFSRLL